MYKQYTKAVLRLNGSYPTLLLLFVSNQNIKRMHNGNEDRVKIGDEEEADYTTNEYLTHADNLAHML